jgi:hypothetical protein
MVLTAKILNSDASLNSFYEISSLDFLPGGPADLVIRIFNPQSEIRYVPGIDAKLTIILNNTDGTNLEKAATVVDAGDRSMWKVSLTAEETENLLGGNFTFELDTEGDDSIVWTGLVTNGIRSLSGDC